MNSCLSEFFTAFIEIGSKNFILFYSIKLSYCFFFWKFTQSLFLSTNIYRIITVFKSLIFEFAISVCVFVMSHTGLE